MLKQRLPAVAEARECGAIKHTVVRTPRHTHHRPAHTHTHTHRDMRHRHKGGAELGAEWEGRGDGEGGRHRHGRQGWGRWVGGYRHGGQGWGLLEVATLSTSNRGGGEAELPVSCWPPPITQAPVPLWPPPLTQASVPRWLHRIVASSVCGPGRRWPPRAGSPGGWRMCHRCCLLGHVCGGGGRGRWAAMWGDFGLGFAAFVGQPWHGCNQETQGHQRQYTTVHNSAQQLHQTSR